MITWGILVLFFLCLVAVHALAGKFSKMDDPARLGGTVNVSETNGFTLRWVAKLDADPATLAILYVHGSPGGAGVWSWQFKEPFPGANLYSMDRPGYGGSGPRRPAPHLHDQAEAVVAVANSATTNRVLLVGHSYGGPIVLEAALEHPGKVAGVLLIGGDVDPGEEHPWWIQYVFCWRATSWLLPKPLQQCNREMLTVRADLEAMKSKLATLSVPVVMLHGDQDPLVPVANVAWLEEQLKAAGKERLFGKIVLPGVNHFIPWEHPDQVTAALEKLVAMVNANAKSQPATPP